MGFEQLGREKCVYISGGVREGVSLTDYRRFHMEGLGNKMLLLERLKNMY